MPRQKWKEEIGNKETLILLSMKPIDNLNLRDWSSINRLFQEDHAKDCQEIEELRRTCCEEAERARQLNADELSLHQRGNPSTVNQFLAHIQDLQDKVNSLNDAR